MSLHETIWLAAHCAHCGSGVMFELTAPRDLPDLRCPGCAADELTGILAGTALRLRLLANGIERREGSRPTELLEWAMSELNDLFRDLTRQLER